MKKIGLIIIIVLMSMNVVYGKDERGHYIAELSIDVLIDEKGNAHIREDVDMYILNDKNISKVIDNSNNHNITNLTIKENDYDYNYVEDWSKGVFNKQKYTLIKTNNQYEICFGVDGYGSKNIIIEYDVSNFVQQDKDCQRIIYDLIGDYSLDMYSVLISIGSENVYFDDYNSEVTRFDQMTIVNHDDGFIKIRMNKLANINKKNRSIIVKIEDGTYLHLEDLNTNYNMISLMGNHSLSYYKNIIFMHLVIIGVIIIIVFSILKKKHNDIFEDGSSLFIDERTVNECQQVYDIDLFEIYFLLRKLNIIDNDKRMKLVNAIILKWIKEGVIVVEKKNNDQIYLFQIDLYQRKKMENPLESELMRYFVNAAGINMRLERKEFEQWCYRHAGELLEWFNLVEKTVEQRFIDKGYIQVDEKEKKNVYNNEMKKKMIDIIGLKKYLSHLSLDMNKHISVELWEDYIIYGCLVNCENQILNMMKYNMMYYNEKTYVSFKFYDYINQNYMIDLDKAIMRRRRFYYR